MNYQNVIADEHIDTIVKLAHETWNEYYPVIITQSQIDYMLDKYQSKSAIHKQLEQGALYYVAYLEAIPAGYFSLIPQRDKQVQLSKFYLLKKYRGRGYASEMFRFIVDVMRQQQLTRIWLTVNKNNSRAIAVYQAIGFVKTNSLVMDIGNGFVMDDFRMELLIS